MNIRANIISYQNPNVAKVEDAVYPRPPRAKP